ncbi:MAG TPA: class II glutamine amidotransferase, partial [Alphaproteobacteria bacterium]|nr:class II glutamine amidotransferase [Alphaproteobacteria bacterium]
MNNSFDDKMHEECGVFGIYGHDDASTLTALGLHALQHRGQESSGIASYDDAKDGGQFFVHRGLGLVDDIFNDVSIIARLKGRSAIGHNRYATTGATLLRNVQPLYAELVFGGFAVAHNGNLTNAVKIRNELTQHGAIFQCTSDTEVIIHLVALSKKATVLDRLVDALQQVEGAYSLICFAEGRMIGVRDPNGFRPLVLGRLGDAYILASETCALDIIGADFVRLLQRDLVDLVFNIVGNQLAGEYVRLARSAVHGHGEVRRRSLLAGNVLFIGCLQR